MNKDIKIMIELQRYWGNILQADAEIDRCNKNITLWEKELTDKNGVLLKLNEEIKLLKNSIKQNELDLTEIDNRIKKLEERRLILKTEREVEALNHELEKFKTEGGDIEEILIGLMDDLDSKSDDSSNKQNELDEMNVQVESDIEKIKSKITGFQKDISDNQSRYDEMLPALSNVVKSRFEKMLKSKGGKGIGEVNGEICGSCNFQIPSSLAAEASHDDKLVVCSNCGRYIYKN